MLVLGRSLIVLSILVETTVIWRVAIALMTVCWVLIRLLVTSLRWVLTILLLRVSLFFNSAALVTLVACLVVPLLVLTIAELLL